MPFSNEPVRWRKLLPVLWLLMAAAILTADYLTGHAIRLTILFILPVYFAARMNGLSWGLAIAVAVPLVHFVFLIHWPSLADITDRAINVAVQIGLLSLFAYLIDRVTRQAREIRTLKGLLHICAFCKKIRVGENRWESIEAYVTGRSQAQFSHTFCPECGKKHYGKYFEKEDDDTT